MLSLLKNWKGTVEVNGVKYDTISDAITRVSKEIPESIHIRLYPQAKTVSTDDDRRTEQRYRIKVKRYMTKEATSTFDFMEKWNNNIPMPSTVMEGTKEQETKGMVFMNLQHQVPGGNVLRWQGWIIKSAIVEEELCM